MRDVGKGVGGIGATTTEHNTVPFGVASAGNISGDIINFSAYNIPAVASTIVLCNLTGSQSYRRWWGRRSRSWRRSWRWSRRRSWSRSGRRIGWRLWGRSRGRSRGGGAGAVSRRAQALRSLLAINFLRLIVVRRSYLRDRVLGDFSVF